MEQSMRESPPEDRFLLKAGEDPPACIDTPIESEPHATILFPVSLLARRSVSANVSARVRM